MIALGSKVSDKLTGYTGIVIARYEWLTGCVRYEVQPEKLDKDGKPKASESFDELRLDVKAKPSARLRALKGSGGPMPNPQRPSGPAR